MNHVNSHELAKARVADRHNQAQLNALAPRRPPCPPRSARPVPAPRARGPVRPPGAGHARRPQHLTPAGVVAGLHRAPGPGCGPRRRTGTRRGSRDIACDRGHANGGGASDGGGGVYAAQGLVSATDPGWYLMMIRHPRPWRRSRAARDKASAAYEKYISRIGRAPAPITADYARQVSDGQAWAAVQDGQVVGFVILIAQPGYLLLENVAVLATAQGRGVGAWLLALARKTSAVLALARSGSTPTKP